MPKKRVTKSKNEKWHFIQILVKQALALTYRGAGIRARGWGRIAGHTSIIMAEKINEEAQAVIITQPRGGAAQFYELVETGITTECGDKIWALLEEAGLTDERIIRRAKERRT